MEAIERQLAELELVSAAYADEVEMVGQDDAGNFSFHCRFRVAPDSRGEVLLKVSFPSGYPESDDALHADVVTSEGVDAKTVGLIQKRIAEFSRGDDFEGGEQAFQLLQAVEEELRTPAHGREEEGSEAGNTSKDASDSDDADDDHHESQGDTETGMVSPGTVRAEHPHCISAGGHEKVVTMFRFDHIKAKFARKTIVQLATEWRLAGLCRPGKPGLVVVEGTGEAVHSFEREMRSRLATCTRNMGCWGPANHHFQSISTVAHRRATALSQASHQRSGSGRHDDTPEETEHGCERQQFVEVETETVMHLAHAMQARGWLDLFWAGTRLSSEFQVPDGPGGPDPYLRARGGTKRKKGNGLVR
eukprot:113861-Rhodomonas_salina.1